MKRFIINLLFTAFLVCAADILLGFALDGLYHRTVTPSLKQNFIIQKSQPNLLLVGPSTCSHNMDANQLSRKLGLEVYNGGQDGLSLYYQYILLSNLFDRHRPAYVVYDLDMTDFRQMKDWGLERINSIGPYFGRNASADSIFRMAEKPFRYYSSLYRYNAKLPNIAQGFFTPHDSLNGYLPLPGLLADSVRHGEDTSFPIDTAKIRYLAKIAELCRRNSVKLAFVVPPKYLLSDKANYREVIDMAARQQVPLLYNRDVISDHTLYKDPAHLNAAGAAAYTEFLGRQIDSLWQITSSKK